MTASEAKEHLDKELSISGLTRKKWYWQIYLKSPHWCNLRKQVFLSQGKKCSKCASEKRLDVHHLKYKNIFDVLPEDLQVLCRPCHRKEHPDKRKARKQKKSPRDAHGTGFKWEPVLVQMMRNAKRKDATLESRCIKKLIKRYRDKLSLEQSKMLQEKRIRLRKEHKMNSCSLDQDTHQSLVWDLESQFFMKTR